MCVEPFSNLLSSISRGTTAKEAISSSCRNSTVLFKLIIRSTDDDVEL